MATAPIAGVKVEDEAVLRALDRLAGWSSKQFGRALWDIGTHLVKSTQERFHTETDPSGRPWEITARKKRFPSAKILTDTGKLRKSIRRRVSQGAGTVTVSSWLARAHILHYGSQNLRRRRRHKRLPPGATTEERRALRRQRAIDKNVHAAAKPIALPARPILGVTSDDNREILDIIRCRALRMWR